MQQTLHKSWLPVHVAVPAGVRRASQDSTSTMQAGFANEVMSVCVGAASCGLMCMCVCVCPDAFLLTCIKTRRLRPAC